MKLIFMKPKVASLSILKALFTDAGENSWIGPSLFDVWGKPRAKRLRVDPAERAFAVSVSERILGEIKNK